MATGAKLETVDAYISLFPEDVRVALGKIRRIIRKAAPEAVESVSYGIPSYKLAGRPLVAFAAWKSHIGMYPIPSGARAFQKELAPYKGAKSTVRFPLDQPIPLDLVKEIVRYRIRDSRRKKRSSK